MDAIMKKAEIGKRANTQSVQKSQQAKNVSRNERLPRASLSMDNLLVAPKHKIQQRKASTPTHDKTALTNSPDISSIQISGAKPEQKGGPRNPKVPVAPSTSAQGKLSIQDELDIQYARYLQATFKNEIAKSRASTLDADLTNLQTRISENERILKLTNERLKNITFNKEVDELYKLHNPNFKKVLDTLDKTNCEEYLSKLNTKLEQTQNQLKVKNIEIPEGGSAQLMRVITDTESALEKLKTNDDVQVPKILKEIEDESKVTANCLQKCTDQLYTCEDLLLTRAVLEISSLEDSNTKCLTTTTSSLQD